MVGIPADHSVGKFFEMMENNYISVNQFNLSVFLKKMKIGFEK